MKRLVDLVNRGPKDAFFTPMDAGATVFHRSTERYHNVVPEIREIGFKDFVRSDRCVDLFRTPPIP